MATIDEIKLDRQGYFKLGHFSMIPYHHHKNKMQWKVTICESDGKSCEEGSEWKIANVSVIADTARKAAFDSIEAYSKKNFDRELCKIIMKQIKEEGKEAVENESRHIRRIGEAE
jgi:hypothetical protein